MSTHPTLLGEMIKQQALDEADRTSLDVERDLGLPSAARSDPEKDVTSRPALLDENRPSGERRQPIRSE